MQNPPSKLSYTAWGKTVSIEHDFSDIDAQEFAEDLLSLIKAAGYSVKTVVDNMDYDD